MISLLEVLRTNLVRDLHCLFLASEEAIGSCPVMRALEFSSLLEL